MSAKFQKENTMTQVNEVQAQNAHTLQPHQQRVVDEKTELELKLSALRGFLYGSVFNGLTSYEQALLLLQEHIMTAYSDVLRQRIKAF